MPDFRNDMRLNEPVPRPAGISAEWRVQREFDTAVLPNLEARISNPSVIASADLLKQATRRLIFRYSDTSMDFLVKAFPLRGINKRRQHQKYADMEAANLMNADSIGLPVPKLYAWARHRRFGMVDWNALITEFVPLPNLEDTINRERNEQRRRELIRLSFPYFKALYETGVQPYRFQAGFSVVG